MKQRLTPSEAVLAALVLVHLGISMVHGFAHTQAGVALSRGAMLFVFVVILIGPVLGLIVQRLALRRSGALVIAGTLAGALAFGVVNHFLMTGADHVSHVAEPWRAVFGATAVLLAGTEALGAALAVRCATSAGRAA